jgi:hypothetical protein
MAVGAAGVSVGEAVIVAVGGGVSVRVGGAVGICAVAVASATCGGGVAVVAHEIVRPKSAIVANAKRFISCLWLGAPFDLKGIALNFYLANS